MCFGEGWGGGGGGKGTGARHLGKSVLRCCAITYLAAMYLSEPNTEGVHMCG